MKDIKIIHLAIVVILVLLSLVFLQWVRLPGKVPPPVTASSAETAPVELPALPQNEPYNSNVVPSFLKELPPFEETSGENQPSSENAAVSSKKPEF